MRDELLSIEQFDTMLEAQVLVADWPANGGKTSFSSRNGWADQRGPVTWVMPPM